MISDKKSLKFFIIIILFFLSINVIAQDSLILKRFIPVISGAVAGYAGGIFVMNELWYKQSERSAFHFHNDLQHWKQMDKAGHFTTAAIESMYFKELLEWTGMPEKKAMFWGCFSGILLQAPIEILDGFSKAYGASTSDFAANSVGAGFIYGQYRIWNEIRIQPKFSFHQTAFSHKRPNILGSNFFEKILKDYNGQTYWLSVNIGSFLNPESKFPKWLNFSLGYGAENLLYAKDESNLEIGIKPYRQYYLSLDVDLTKIPTNNKFLKVLFYNLNFVHIPLPALEYSRKSITFHPIYF